MVIPRGLRLHSAIIGWIVFAVLSLPILFFSIRLSFSEGLTFSKIVVAAIEVIMVGLASWFLRYGLSKGSAILVVMASIVLIAILAAYAAAISLLIGGLKIKVF